VKTKSPKLVKITLREDYVRSTPASVDAAQGVIKGVKILGLLSENGRRYSRQALDKAKPLYENRLVNVDHPDKPQDQRSAYDRFGKLANVQLREDGLYGDLILLRTHPLATRVLEAAERMPDLFGLSHNADGKGFTDTDGVFVVEEITLVRSVDLVADAATNKSLFEGRTMQTTLKKLIEGSKAAKAVKTWLLEADDATLGSELPAEPEGDWKQDLVAAIGKLVSSEDEGDHAMAKKIMGMLRPASMEPAPKEEGEGDEPDKKKDDDEDEKKKEAKESKKSKAPAAGSSNLTEAKAKSLIGLAGLREDKALVEAITKLPEDDAVSHLAYIKTLQRPGNPARSSSPGNIVEGRKSASGKDFAKIITQR